MSLEINAGRRLFTHALASLATAVVTPLWAQPGRADGTIKQATVVQIVDVSTSQIDVSKDFLVGSRAAWQDINAKGGLRGRSVLHKTLEVDGSDASLRLAIDTLKGQPQMVACLGTVGGHAATRVAEILAREVPDMPHIAPWLQNTKSDTGDNTFAIFASRQEQIAHAVRSLAVVGVSEIGAVYATQAEFAAFNKEVERTATALNLRLQSYGPAPDIQRLAQSLSTGSPRILIFLGGTPELLQFTQGIEKQATLRYIIAMSDVNLQTLTQAGMSRHAPVIATQVVPMVNSNVPVVRSYRETLSRLFDEPPTPQGLAGFIASRYAFEAMQSIDGLLNRTTLMQALQRRGSTDLGGFRIDLDGKRRSGSYVTQSMISNDGRIVG
jgi:ABC-type branched-subunit amino acid transport system substrate-binding protein